MPSRLSRTAAFAIAFALLLGACGDDDDAGDGTTTTTEAGAGDDATTGDEEEPETVTATAEEYIAAVVASATPEELEVIGEERSECIATAYVTAVGAEALQQAGVTPEEFAAQEFSLEDESIEVADGAREQLATDFTACGDAQELFVGLIRSAGAEVSAEQEACVTEAVSAEAAVGYFVAGLLGEDPDPALQDAVRPCFPELDG